MIRVGTTAWRRLVIPFFYCVIRIFSFQISIPYNVPITEPSLFFPCGANLYQECKSKLLTILCTARYKGAYSANIAGGRLSLNRFYRRIRRLDSCALFPSTLGINGSKSKVTADLVVILSRNVLYLSYLIDNIHVFRVSYLTKIEEPML